MTFGRIVDGPALGVREFDTSSTRGWSHVSTMLSCVTRKVLIPAIGLAGHLLLATTMINDATTWFSLWKLPSVGSRMTRRKRSGRVRRRNCISIEMLESRQLLATITWSTSAAATGGDWNVGTNWVGGVVPVAGDKAVINGLTSPGTVFLNSGSAESVGSLATDSSTNLELIGTSSPRRRLVVLGRRPGHGGVGRPLMSAASFTIGAAQTVTVNGTLSFANGDAGRLERHDRRLRGRPGSGPIQIAVAANGSGTVNAIGAKFTTNGVGTLPLDPADALPRPPPSLQPLRYLLQHRQRHERRRPLR